MAYSPSEFSELIYISPTRYGAQLVRSWLLHAGVGTVILTREDSQNNPELRKPAAFEVCCKLADVPVALQVLERLQLGTHRIQPQDRVHLFPEWDDEDLLTEMIEELHHHPDVSIAAYMELLKRDKAPTQIEIDGYLQDLEAGWNVLETPTHVTLLHYLKAFLLPPWGFYIAAKMVIRGNNRIRAGHKWGAQTADVSIGAVTFLFAFAGFSIVLAVVLTFWFRR